MAFADHRLSIGRFSSAGSQGGSVAGTSPAFAALHRPGRGLYGRRFAVYLNVAVAQVGGRLIVGG
jgi:hypothetical protein